MAKLRGYLKITPLSRWLFLNLSGKFGFATHLQGQKGTYEAECVTPQPEEQRVNVPAQHQQHCVSVRCVCDRAAAGFWTLCNCLQNQV